MDVEEFRAVGHRAIELLAGYLSGIGQRRVFPDVGPRALEGLFAEALPESGRPLDELLDEFEKKILPYSTHVGHPGYLGLITPSPTTAGVIADLLASALNQNVGAYSIGPAAVSLERRVVRWLSDLVGFGPGAGGHLTSGGMMANFEGLKLARDRISDDRAQHDGVQGRCAVYTSEERHVSVDKAVDSVGLGRNALRVLPTDDAYQLRLDALEAAIADDKAKGIRPVAVVALAGTTNTGSVDPLRPCAPSASARRCGCTWTPPMAAGCCSPQHTRDCSPASSWPTRSPSTPTSGSTRRSTPGRSWSATPASSPAPSA
jgi:aromatic-L-amino-acid decarboxylase